MPFTIDGEWIPTPSSSPRKPIKIIKEKRRSSFVTILLNLPQENAQLAKLCSELKQELACGGTVKEGRIELQGDQTELVKIYLKNKGLK